MKVQYVGRNELTRVPPTDEIRVNPGDVFEVDEARGRQLCRKAVFAPADPKAKVTVKSKSADKADADQKDADNG